MRGHSTADKNTRLGLSLVELLAALALVGVLAGILTPAFNGARTRSLEAQCSAKLRSLGSAMQLYAVEHDGRFPRSFHSAGANREPGWAASIVPYLTGQSVENLDWESTFNRYYRSPFDEETNPLIYSYGLNVHFELHPSEDYAGSPQTWRHLADVPHPSQTVMMARTTPVMFGDHFMCHFWSSLRGAQNSVRVDKHDGKAHFLYVDGRVERQRVEETFDPAAGLNRWNPSLAARR